MFYVEVENKTNEEKNDSINLTHVKSNIEINGIN
jgi:hypothetical protein